MRDSRIVGVIDPYQQAGKMFGWLAGPSRRPANLGERLVAAGLTRVEDECMYGMVLDDLSAPVPTNPKIRVEMVSAADWDANTAMLSAAYGVGFTEEAAWGIVRFHEARGDQARLYLAYVPEQEVPVSFFRMLLDQGGRARRRRDPSGLPRTGRLFHYGGQTSG